MIFHLPPIQNTMEALCSIGRLVCFDKRGQGLSDPSPGDPTLEEPVHDLEPVIDAAGMDRVVLIGVSEGGARCLKFAHDHPERVRGLVLLGSTVS